MTKNEIRLDEIRLVAKDVRKWAENIYETQEGDVYTKGLQGLCAIASYELFKRLQEKDLEPTLCMADIGHAFVVCEEMLIDVTATQFSYEASRFNEIEIIPIEEAEKLERFWRRDSSFKKVSDIIERSYCWPNDQVHPEILAQQKG